MRILLDTCTLIWLVSDPDQLSPRCAELIDDEANELCLSDVSVWEIALKWRAGKIGLPHPPRTWVEAQVKAWTLRAVGIERAHLYRESELQEHHRDPFDRLLVAQAIEAGLTLLTPDPDIAKYPASVLW